ncbi:MAG TPA: tRNA (adenosine(37)-N6)-threonylcarbamoyltransferase complex dimerization subunit type 1 TsaB [Gemmatales bacterium]|nr:tRNA (adenosine(37)-N6)-threonylcarbamoyltransferase complex dimerization subunit type 1 TsaB [Gemmatales bacterium]
MTNPVDAKLLLIETSGAVGRVGLGLGEALLAEAVLENSRQHTRDLIPQCKRLFEEQQWKPGDLDAIVVSIGPGSYTGLRVGIMTAKAMAYALNKPLLAVPTFDVIAWQCFQAQSHLTALSVVADGQQDRVYVQQFSRDMTTLAPLSIFNGEQWRASLIAGSAITGPGLRQQQAKLPPSVQLLDEPLWDPALPSLLALGHSHLLEKKFADCFSLEPLYLRASSAEEQWAALGK